MAYLVPGHSLSHRVHACPAKSSLCCDHLKLLVSKATDGNTNIYYHSLPSKHANEIKTPYQWCVFRKGLVLSVPLVCLVFIRESADVLHLIRACDIPCRAKPDKYGWHGCAVHYV